ncbi:hemolysin C [Caedimonas varicaedens]|uniref:Hemolysin C n=1 Tax=Caedimonas varicaedens TaxID=1629334 RepID=A0A0K8MDX4_9PROT|nr:hemolysin C [Caedimonas varicaedens]
MAHPVIERFLKILFRKNPDSVRKTITELIQESPQEGSSSLNSEERTLLSNVLRLRDMSVDDVKIPRADIIAISVDIKFTELIKLISETPFTRLPVYHHTLDDLLGHIHVKDIALHAKNSDFNIRNIIQQVLFVPPSMRLLDLLLQMRSTQIPMAYVVDEYGGVDGLVTSWDIIREILGDLQDDHTPEISSQITSLDDGTYIIDARLLVEDLEERVGKILTDEERQEDIETVGGLIMYLAGRVPDCKEVISHSSGIEFEVLEASPRSITRLRLRPVKP